MHGLRWQVMEMETTTPSLDPTPIRPSSGKNTAKTKGDLVSGQKQSMKSVSNKEWQEVSRNFF